MPLEKKSDYFFTGVYNSDINIQASHEKDWNYLCHLIVSCWYNTRNIFWRFHKSQKTPESIWLYNFSFI